MLEELFLYLQLAIAIGFPLITGLCTLGFLVACVYDLLARRRAIRQGRDAVELSRHLKRSGRNLLISAILFACAVALTSVIGTMVLGNM